MRHPPERAPRQRRAPPGRPQRDPEASEDLIRGLNGRQRLLGAMGSSKYAWLFRAVQCSVTCGDRAGCKAILQDLKKRAATFMSDVNFLTGYDAWLPDSMPQPCASCRHMLQTEDERHAAMIWVTLPVIMDAKVVPWPIPRAAAEVRRIRRFVAPRPVAER